MNIKSLYKFLSPKFQTIHLEYKVNPIPRFGWGKPAHEELYKTINSNRSVYSDLLKYYLQYKNVFRGIKTADIETNEDIIAWNNGHLPGLDIIALYSLLNYFKPEKYIEVGSGNSTKVAHKSIKENNLKTIITSIDPFPRANIDHLANNVIRKPFEDIDYNFIFELKENDILFIDNSHRALPNSDVTVFFLEILHKLNPGVIVHIHDIYLPYDYPNFMTERFYSEQYLLACYLLSNKDRFEVISPNFFISEDPELKEILNDVWQSKELTNVEKHGGSFWMKVK
ncbi:MAG: class I SAM-dependent methyltransferase [Bacteroidetes bacterium HGW-Bacteroidetes-21]|jgi:hypothetical protein|nr:MAG: class I SAM-dependent methyltransferase [Bacteroidetes bacterium HGW-Bacteroidetes-21]